MRLIKDCALRIKGRCKKLGHYCCEISTAPLTSCPHLGATVKTTEKKGKKKK